VQNVTEPLQFGRSAACGTMFPQEFPQGPWKTKTQVGLED